MKKKEEKMHNKQNVCYICKKTFSTDDSKKKYFKVKDHCHYTGKYRGPANDICNLIYSHAHYQVLLMIYLKDFMVKSPQIVNLAFNI